MYPGKNPEGLAFSCVLFPILPDKPIHPDIYPKLNEARFTLSRVWGPMAKSAGFVSTSANSEGTSVKTLLFPGTSSDIGNEGPMFGAGETGSLVLGEGAENPLCPAPLSGVVVRNSCPTRMSMTDVRHGLTFMCNWMIRNCINVCTT